MKKFAKVLTNAVFSVRTKPRHNGNILTFNVRMEQLSGRELIRSFRTGDAAARLEGTLSLYFYF